jgi:hypothetical protein
MAFQIPRIQYANMDTVGDTAAGNGTLLNIPSTVGLAPGMFARGVNIPAGALIGVVAANSITLAAGVLATGTTPGGAVSFGNEILFDYPPVEPEGEVMTTDATVSQSLSGQRQTAVNYVESVRNLTFSFVSPTLKALMDTFLQTWGLLGNQFRYFEDQTSNVYVLWELSDLTVDPTKRAPASATTYVWDIPLNFRRAL